MRGEIDDVRIARRKTHGNFAHGAAYTQAVTQAAMRAPNWNGLTDVERECFIHIQQKLQRIVCGQSIFDHWVDIGGYAMIAADEVTNKKPKRSKRTGRVKDRLKKRKVGDRMKNKVVKK